VRALLESVVISIAICFFGLMHAHCGDASFDHGARHARQVTEPVR
jgi:hypothetical protein